MCCMQMLLVTNILATFDLSCEMFGQNVRKRFDSMLSLKGMMIVRRYSFNFDIEFMLGDMS